MVKLLKLSLVLVAGAVLAGCASTPAQIQFEQPNLSFTQVAQNPEA